ncbi:hypothetical protein BDV36DRAFT_269984 [Aspergillus pseudocaelatus]|uniref:Secreted protein n=1 Tax=Aspergillus pseudocaelatus TaxID=1825620 RepID=A0ABQ6W704_9EURO|nr:hypothetical protein BDV36DRAFT_269984 [Aspergillus pseudocaelatus]
MKQHLHVLFLGQIIQPFLGGCHSISPDCDMTIALSLNNDVLCITQRMKSELYYQNHRRRDKVIGPNPQYSFMQSSRQGRSRFPTRWKI